jgi:mono/diheme cytochrome c family protein
MKKILKWVGLAVLVMAAGGLLAFLYYIPPFFTTSPEEFSATMKTAAPPASDIADPLQRAMAERGREIVVRTGCIGCHAVNGPNGPDYTKYLGGGGIRIHTPTGTFVSRNLTPDPETGLTQRSDDEVKRVLRSGVFPDGHVVPSSAMPWANFSNWTEEDRHAVVVYLRHLKPVRHKIPDPVIRPEQLESGAIERDYAFKDYGLPEK